MANTRDETIRQTTQAYLQTIDPDNLPDSDEITGEILDQCEQAIAQINSTRQTKWKVLHNLIPSQIADIILHCHKVVLIDYAGGETGKDMSVLGIYQDVGENEGIYVTDENVLRSFFRKYDYSITKREEDEVIHILRLMAPRRTRCEDVDLIPVNNGIFNYKTKILEPFDPEYIFTAKSRVDYNPIATNVVIHNSDDNTDWDVESWMNELSDDPAVVKLLWQILGAIIRPNVAWDKSAWFYSEAGNNGKGTLCELMRQLCGKGTSVSIPLSDMGKDFMLEPLIHASAIIVDENDVGTFIDKAANLKALVTHDVIQVNRKFKTPVAFRFKGFMVQCLNEMPRVKDKSDSFFRRQLFIPFTKCFTGKERKYIKHDYLHRKEVLEYVLYRVLHMDYYELDVPAICMQALAEYREFNDPIRQFAEEILPQLRWDLVPFRFLYDLYVSWYQRNFPDTRYSYNSRSFKKGLLNLLPEYPEWENKRNAKNEEKTHSPAGKMDWPEPLILEYNLTGWMNPRYRGSTDVDKLCKPPQKAPSYRGLIRVNPISVKSE